MILLLIFFQAINYKDLLGKKLIYFSPTFLKSWVHIFDNVAGVVEGPQHYYKGYRFREVEGVFSLSSNYLDDVFTLKDLLDLERKHSLKPTYLLIFLALFQVPYLRLKCQ